MLTDVLRLSCNIFSCPKHIQCRCTLLRTIAYTPPICIGYSLRWKLLQHLGLLTALYMSRSVLYRSAKKYVAYRYKTKVWLSWLYTDRKADLKRVLCLLLVYGWAVL